VIARHIAPTRSSTSWISGLEYSSCYVPSLPQRFDYACVDSMQAFRNSDRALTAAGTGAAQSRTPEKDDRRDVNDRRSWVLGFEQPRQACVVRRAGARAPRHRRASRCGISRLFKTGSGPRRAGDSVPDPGEHAMAGKSTSGQCWTGLQHSTQLREARRETRPARDRAATGTAAHLIGGSISRRPSFPPELRATAVRVLQSGQHWPDVDFLPLHVPRVWHWNRPRGAS